MAERGGGSMIARIRERLARWLIADDEMSKRLARVDYELGVREGREPTHDRIIGWHPVTPSAHCATLRNMPDHERRA